MPDFLSDEDVGLSQDLSDNDVGLGASPQQLAAFSLAQGMTIPAKVASMYQAGAGAQRKMLQEAEVPVLDPETQMPVAYQTDASTSPVGSEYLRRGAQYGLQKAQELQESLGEMYVDFAHRTGLDPSAMIGRPAADVSRVPIGVSPLELIPGVKRFKEGLETGAGKFLSGLTTPEVGATLPFAELEPVQAMFGAQALAQVPDSIRALYQSKTPQEAGEAVFGAGANIAMGGLIGRHLLTGKGLPNARSVEEATKVHGDLFSQPGEGARQVPAQESRAGVQPSSEAVAEAAQVPLKVLDADELLNPQESVLLQTVGQRNGLKGELRIVENFDDPEHKVVAQSGLAEVDENNNFKAPGQVTVSRDALRLWMQAAPEGTLHPALAGMISEELLHSFTTPTEALNYWDTLTPREQEISKRLYLGPKTEADVPGGFNDVKAGAEAVRQRLQRVMRLKPTEIAEVAGKESWTRASVEMVARLIRRAREWIGTAAAKQGQQITARILDRTEQNVNAASEAIGEEAPFLIRRSTAPEEESARDFEDKSGFTFNPAKQVGGISFEGLSPEQVKALKDAGYGSQWEFTDRRKGSPTEALTFYVPEGSTPEQINAAYQKKLAAEPQGAAMVRRKEGKDEPVLPGMAATKGKGVLSKPETAPAGARPELVKEPPTPMAVDKASYEHLYTMAEQALDPHGKPISFDKYAEAMRVKFGAVPTPALVESFERNLWPTLMGLSGDKLTALRDKLDLRSKVGSREVSDPPPRKKLLEGEAADPGAVRDSRKMQLAKQRYRNTVLSAIAGKLTQEAVDRSQSAMRTEVSPYDLWKDRDRRTGKMKQKAPVQPIYNELTENERASPAVLAKVLTDDASDMKAATRSTTKRLTVLVNKETGKVEMVSTFRDPRRGAVLLDPMHPNLKHQPLESILKRYLPVASVLLDDPVKNFRKSFDSLSDYENQFGGEARKAGVKSFGEEPMGEGEQQIPGTWEVNAPISRAESGAMLDHITSEVGRFDSPDDVKASLNALSEVTNRQALSAFRKLFAELERQNPDASVEELLDKLSKNIYDNHNQAKDYEDFVSRTVAQGRAPVSEAAGVQPLAPNVPKGVESVVPKISVEPRVVPGGRAGAFIPQEQPSPMLSPEAQAHVQAMAEERYPSLERAPEEVGDSPEETAQMLTRRDVRDKAEAAFWTSLGQLRSMFTRHGTKQDIAKEAAAASTRPINLSQQAKRNIELPSASKKNKDGNPEILAASRAINAAYVAGRPEHSALANLWQLTQDGQAKASQLLATPTDATLAALGLGDITGASKGEIMSMARQWLHAAEDLQKEVEYGQDHFGERDLMRTTRALRIELKSQLLWERAHGRNTKEAENYLPGLYKGEVYGDNSVTFASRILGRQFGKPKSFANTYEAIANGPFIPKLNNVAEIAAHRIRSGLNAVMTDEAFHAAQHMTDPATGTPVMVPMDFDPKRGYSVPKGLEQYVPVYPIGGGPPMAVRRGYESLIKNLFGRSGLSESPTGKALMGFGAIEKHTTLAADVYHLAKMGYFAAATMWEKAGWKSGYGALEYRPTNMGEAVSRGLLRQKDMDWALATEPVNIGGTVSQMSHYDISKFLQEQGLNVGRVQDAMYKHFVDELDVTLGGKRLGLGRYTRFLFDKFTRGIMNQAAVDAFVQHNKDLAQGGAPVPAERIAKKVVGDINTMFGSAGKQAMIKNPTLRDINQLIWLAPQWTGTRISMEAKALSRLATVPYKAARFGLPEARLEAGPIGKAVGTGLLAMFGITQVLNMAFNGGKTTFQNPEEGHKLDAHIKINGEDHWISPLSVFMETLHDVLRFAQVKQKGIPETITAIAGNKLHPVARGAASAMTGFTPTGQKITTMGGRLKALGTGMVPVPISFGSLSRFIGHELTDRIAPNPPGAGVRQAFSTIGVKSEVGERPGTQIQKLADAYMKKNDLKPPTGWQQIQTDEPSYTKLRSAIRAGDTREAKALIKTLSDTHPPIKTATGTKDAVVHAMEVYAKHNFASKRDEADFKASLTPGQRRIYEDAKDEREIELQKFYDLYDSVR